ncbi:hypothetical protein A7P95_06775 [Eikenella longinqua]|uniref:Uncharacterized protein n=1 Tax=Eikenella longinqua TaxID=1795827 RepID=A0A1A9RWS6_9NEIS|nr:hypothetical protein A7P95_06775 [Eikenella longinqua]
MTAHKHAALMLQYAQDAAETDRPWERWEVSDSTKYDSSGRLVRNWRQLGDNPDWNSNVRYRRKPQVIRVGRHEFPKPLINELVIGVNYFYVKIGNTCFEAAESSWMGNGQDQMRLESKRVHLTREAAQAHADVLNAICRGDID